MNMFIVVANIVPLVLYHVIVWSIAWLCQFKREDLKNILPFGKVVGFGSILAPFVIGLLPDIQAVMITSIFCMCVGVRITVTVFVLDKEITGGQYTKNLTGKGLG